MNLRVLAGIALFLWANLSAAEAQLSFDEDVAAEQLRSYYGPAIDQLRLDPLLEFQLKRYFRGRATSRTEVEGFPLYSNILATLKNWKAKARDLMEKDGFRPEINFGANVGLTQPECMDRIAADLKQDFKPEDERELFVHPSMKGHPRMWGNTILPNEAEILALLKSPRKLDKCKAFQLVSKTLASGEALAPLSYPDWRCGRASPRERMTIATLSFDDMPEFVEGTQTFGCYVSVEGGSSFGSWFAIKGLPKCEEFCVDNAAENKVPAGMKAPSVIRGT